MAEDTAVSRYYFYSEKAGDVARQSSSRALGIVRIFKSNWSGKPPDRTYWLIVARNTAA